MRSIMILYRNGAVILLHLFAVSVVVHSYVCLLKKRPDPSRDGNLRWSLLFKELCYCQRVLAPRFISQDTCPIKDESCPDGNACNLWFVNDPTPLTQRQNWNKDSLDMLLERVLYCKETTQAPTETIVTGKAELEETTQAETGRASSSLKTDAVETSTSVVQDETTQAEIEEASLIQKTGAVETTSSADQDETTHAETEGARSNQKTGGVETSKSAAHEATTQPEAEKATSSQKTDAIEASAAQDETTQAEEEGARSSQKTDAVETSTSADPEETTQAETEGASSSQKNDDLETSTSDDQGSSTCTAETATTVASATTTEVCKPRPLGMASGEIPDESITASSHQPSRDPQYARLHGGVNVFWLSAGEYSEQWIGPWIQVDLGSSRRVTGLQTKGNNDSTYWVAEVSVEVGMSEAYLKYIEDDNEQPKVFDANTDQYNVADIILDESGILTRLVRIYPTLCMKNGEPWYTCLMKFEVLGCLEN